MPKLKPFQALYYNKLKVDLAKVITPPYDVISKEHQADLQSKSLYNFVHIILPAKEGEDYTLAADRLEKWKKAEVLCEGPGPRFYLYQQNFEAEGKRHSRNCLMASVHLSEFSEGQVRPHEKIHQYAADDRLRILEKTQKNLSPIFAALMDKTGFLENEADGWSYSEPLLRTRLEDGVEHVVWEIPEKDSAKIEAFVAQRPIYIVDGHHRYTSALQYAKNCGTLGKEAPSSYMFVAIANAYDPAMIIYPTHRLIRGIPNERRTIDSLAKDFRIFPMDLEHLKGILRADQPDFGLYINNKLYHCQPKNIDKACQAFGKPLGSLAVVWSDLVLTKDIFQISEPEKSLQYFKDEKTWWDLKDDADAAVLLPPLTMQQIAAVSDEGGFMPQKSTYFYPKLAAGMILRELK